MNIRRFLSAAAILLSTPFAASAQIDSAAADPPAVLRAESFPDGGKVSGLGGMIRIHVRNLEEFLDRHPDDRDRIRLFINGLMMPGSQARVGGQGDKAYLDFRLSRDTVSRDEWAAFYQAHDFTMNASISVGYEGEKALESRVDDYQIVLARKGFVRAIWLVLLLLVAGTFWMGRKTPLLRDEGLNGPDGPYSLSRVQLAFWTLIVSLSFLYIWVSTGDYASVAGSTLVLLGISLGTTATATVIDKNQDSLNRHQNQPSQNFLADILSDANGLSMHRFQMVVWNIILSVVFVFGVWHDYAMPQFNDSLLMLMGASSGAYLALKVPENKAGSAEPGKAPVDSKDPGVPAAVG